MKTSVTQSRLGYLLLAAITLAVYANSLDNPFHYDDMHSIVDNPHLRDLGRIPSFFVDPTTFSENPDNAMYRPLLLTSFALNYAIGGYEVRGYHLVSIVLHLGCALLVGGLVRRILDERWAGWFAAALFALHPIHTESVNYISTRSEVLAAFFLLLGIWNYLRAGPWRWLWVGGAYGAGLLCKSSVVVLPALLLVYELVCRRRIPVKDRGLFALLGAMGGLYVIGVWSWLEKATYSAPVRSFAEQFWTQIKAMVFYLRLLFWPSGQSVDHQFLLSDTFFDPIAGSAACALVSLIGIAVYHRRRYPVPLLGLGWFFIALAPASLVPLNVLVNEHRLYVPGAAFALVVAYAGMALRSKVGNRWVVGLGLAILVAASWVTVERNTVWRSEYALWSDAAAKAPLMARPFIYLGEAYARDGRVEEAVVAFNHVVRRDPNFAPAYARLGKLYLGQGEADRAQAILEEGVGIDRESPDIWMELADLHRSRQQWPESLAAYQQAVEFAPGVASLRNNLGNTYQVLNRPHEALAEHREALALLPGDAETLLNLGNALLMLERYDEAMVRYREALNARGDFAGAWFNLGYAYERGGKADRALEAYARAAALDPDYGRRVAERRHILRGER